MGKWTDAMCDRALVLHDPSDEDAPRMVFGKLVVSDDFVMG